jgi:signal peptidase I
MRVTARNWIEMAEKVWSYRRDVLSEADRKELCARTEDLRQKVSSKADAAELKLGIEALEPVLQRLGGKIYPKTTMIDNVEFFLVAAIVVLGFRAFIAQPFKIPTNSMWPSYYGMTADNLMARNENPNPVMTALRFVTLGAFRQEASAAKAGELSFKVFPDGRMAYTVVKGRKWLVIPTEYKEYTFFVDNTEAKIRVPTEFSEFDEVMQTTLFGGIDGYRQALMQASANKHLTQSTALLRQGSNDLARVLVLQTGKTYVAGQPIMRFDILTGDQLFVDRISYHFVQPKPGDGFVFRTGNIAGIGMDSYYIKRLVGTPGDKIEIREPMIYRNGAPITGATAFDLNGTRSGKYAGYFDSTTLERRGGLWPFLKKGEVLTVPAGKFFAMGDNSGNSRDSREWGFVPAADVIGRPLFIYFPFTERVGGAR